MTSTVRDVRGVTHVAILWSVDQAFGESSVIGALCEDTYERIFDFNTVFTLWNVNEIEDDMPDCMTCLVKTMRTP